MKRSETIGQLAKSLASAQGEIEGAKRDSNNPFFKSKYADLASVRMACQSALTKHGVAVIQGPSVDNGVVYVTTVLAHESGEWAESTLSAVPKDASPQSIGSAITYLRRYALAAMVGVAPEDDDGEAAQPRGGYPHPGGHAPVHAPVEDKAALAKAARVKALVAKHGTGFRQFMAEKLGRTVENASQLTLGDLSILEGEASDD